MTEVSSKPSSLTVSDAWSPRSSIDKGMLKVYSLVADIREAEDREALKQAALAQERIRSKPASIKAIRPTIRGIVAEARRLLEARKQVPKKPWQEYLEFDDDPDVAPDDSKSDASSVHYQENYGDDEEYKQGQERRVELSAVPAKLGDAKAVAWLSELPVPSEMLEARDHSSRHEWTAKDGHRV